MPEFDLDLKEMLLGDPNRLRYVTRFGTCRRLHTENVAEHSFFVMFYARMLAIWTMARGLEVDVAKLMTRALVHDLEEARSGDFPRPFKYSSPEVKTALDAAASEAFLQMMRPLTPKSDLVAKALHAVWEDAKNDDVEGRIVAFADFLSCLSYLWYEVRAGNTTMLEHAREMDVYVRTFDKPAFGFLRPFILEATRLTDQVFEAAKKGGVGA